MKVNTNTILKILKFVEDEKCPKDVIPQFKNQTCYDTCIKCWINSLERIDEHTEIEVIEDEE